MLPSRWILTASLCFVAACGIKTEYIELNPPPHVMAPRSPDQVAIFTTGLPERPYVEVGTIEVKQEIYNGASASEIMRVLREEAARRGCDGLVLLGANDETVVEGSSGSHGGSVSSKTLKGYRATCIVYKGGVAETAPATSAPTHGS